MANFARSPRTFGDRRSGFFVLRSSSSARRRRTFAVPRRREATRARRNGRTATSHLSRERRTMNVDVRPLPKLRVRVPELPEVESVRRRLEPVMAGARFDDVVARRPDLRMPFPRNFGSRLTGQTVLALTRRAKYLLAELSSHETLLMHLGMSGSFRVGRRWRRRRCHAGRHDHVVFHMSSGAIVTFNDPRRFGFMDLVPAGQLAQSSRPQWRSGPSRCQRRSTPGRWRGRAGERRLAQGRRCWINASSPVSATSTSSKRCTVPGCRRTGRRRRSPPRPACRVRRRIAWRRPSNRC